jgi:hypothetical protein
VSSYGNKPYDLELFTDDELEELKTIRPDLLKEIAAEQQRRATQALNPNVRERSSHVTHAR